MLRFGSRQARSAEGTATTPPQVPRRERFGSPSDTRRPRSTVRPFEEGCAMSGAFLDGVAVIRVTVSQIHRETSAWPRKRLDPRRVEDFLTLLLEEGIDAFDPVELVQVGQGDYVVADGNHRFEAISQTS